MLRRSRRYTRVPTSTGGVHDRFESNGAFALILKPLRRRVRDHQVAVLIERDQLLVRPDERGFLDAALLPVDFAGADVDRAENRLAAPPARSQGTSDDPWPNLLGR